MGGNTDREWTLRGVDRRKGANAGETQERRIRRLIQDEYRRAEGDAKLTEDALGVVSCKHQRAGQAREDPEDQRGNTERSWGEQRRSNELLLRLTGCGSTVRENGVSVPTLEGQANITGAVVMASARTSCSHTSNL
jgi:hypothetical protein